LLIICIRCAKCLKDLGITISVDGKDKATDYIELDNHQGFHEASKCKNP